MHGPQPASSSQTVYPATSSPYVDQTATGLLALEEPMAVYGRAQ
jgi:hypothetical protein